MYDLNKTEWDGASDITVFGKVTLLSTRDTLLPMTKPGVSLPFPSSSSARKEGASSPVSGKELDVSTSKTQLTPSSKEGDVKDMTIREQETSSLEPLPSDSPKEELRPPR